MRRFITVAAAGAAAAGLAGCATPAVKSAGPQQSPGTMHGSALPASSSPVGTSTGSSGVWKSPIRCPAVADVSAATGIPGLTVAGRNITNAAGEAACVYASANDSGSVLIKHPPIQVGSTPGTLDQFRQALGAVEPVIDAPAYGTGAFLTGSAGACWLYANFGDGMLIDIQVALFTPGGTTQKACADVRHTAQLLTN